MYKQVTTYDNNTFTNETKTMDEIEVVLKRFGDEQSTLLDQFERLSFEVQLNQAILARSLSEPGVFRSQRALQPLNGQAQHKMVTQVKQGRRGSGFNKVLKKLLKPILGKKGGTKKDVADPKNPMSWKSLSRSLRL